MAEWCIVGGWGCGDAGIGSIGASIGGTVADQTEAIVQGAKIGIRNTDTIIERSTVAGSAGHYVVSSISPGNCTICTSNANFATVEETDIVLSVNQTLTYNLLMKPERLCKG